MWNDCSSCDIGNVFWQLPIKVTKKSNNNKGCSNELCGQFLLAVGFSFSGARRSCCCRRHVLLVVDIGV